MPDKHHRRLTFDPLMQCAHVCTHIGATHSILVAMHDEVGKSWGLEFKIPLSFMEGGAEIEEINPLLAKFSVRL